MLRTLKRIIFVSLAAIGAIVVSVIVAVAGSAFVQYAGRNNHADAQRYEDQPYD